MRLAPPSASILLATSICSAAMSIAIATARSRSPWPEASPSQRLAAAPAITIPIRPSNGTRSRVATTSRSRTLGSRWCSPTCTGSCAATREHSCSRRQSRAVAGSGVRVVRLARPDLGAENPAGSGEEEVGHSGRDYGMGQERRPPATFSARTALPPPPSRTPAGSRASSRHASIAPRTTSARGPQAWDAP
jgi:hypothetical protein